MGERTYAYDWEKVLGRRDWEVRLPTRRLYVPAPADGAVSRTTWRRGRAMRTITDEEDGLPYRGLH